MNVNYKLNLDVYKDRTYESITVAQNDDKSRIIECKLYADSQPVALSSSVTAAFNATVDNVIVAENIPCTITDNIINVALEKSMLQLAGMMQCELVLTENDTILTTQHFTVYVVKSVINSKSKYEPSGAMLSSFEAVQKLRAVCGINFVVPQAYGAKGDGKHDDTYALQSAIDSGYGVYIPAGTYRTGKLTVSNSNAKIWGDGVDNTILIHDDLYTEDDCVIHITDSSNITLSSFSVEGGGSTAADSNIVYNGIMISNCTKGAQNVIENINVYKCSASGIKLKNSCIGCQLSNIHTYLNTECGVYNEGYGNKIVNLDTHQNYKDGIKIDTGGFNGTNIKSWGNRRDGVNMDNMWNKVACVNLCNISVQQNGRHGLMMTNCRSCVITSFQSTSNNYISNSRLMSGETLQKNTAGILITDNNHNNYIQGNITSSYEYWNSFEESSIRISGKNNTNNIIDVSVCTSADGADMYNVCFVPVQYTANNKQYTFDNYIKLNEYSTLKQKYDNPLNTVKINGKTVNDTSMNDIKKSSSVTHSYMKKADGSNCIQVSDNLSEISDILQLNLSDYSELQACTIDELKGISDVDIAKVAYRRGYNIVIKNCINDVIYLKLIAKVSEYKAFGIFPVVQVSYKNDSGTQTYEYLDTSLNYAKSNVIFNTDYIEKNIALDISKFKNKDITLFPRLCITKLSDKTISDTAIQDTATISVKEFSYKFS